MRCLTLADILKEAGWKCHFICRDLEGHMGHIIHDKGHSIHLLPKSIVSKRAQNSLPHSHWLEVPWGQDAKETRSILDSIKPLWLIVDHYALDRRWEESVLFVGCKLMVIDDLADREHVCKVLLDQNLGREASAYDSLVPDHCTRLIGVAYALLRPDFSQWREYSLARRKNPKLAHILITMGGMDKDNVTAAILDELAECALPKSIHITVVMGVSAPHLEDIRQKAATMPIKTTVNVDVQNMAELMANADLAIGAAGSTSWERMCLGLPSIVIVTAENQRSVSSAFKKYSLNIGMFDIVDKTWQSSFRYLLMNYIKFHQNFRTSEPPIDGLGCTRIVKEIFYD